MLNASSSFAEQAVTALPYQQLEKQAGACGLSVCSSDKTLDDGHKWNFNENGKVLSQRTGIFWKFYTYFDKYHNSENNSHFQTKD